MKTVPICAVVLAIQAIAACKSDSLVHRTDLPAPTVATATAPPRAVTGIPSEVSKPSAVAGSSAEAPERSRGDAGHEPQDGDLESDAGHPAQLGCERQCDGELATTDLSCFCDAGYACPASPESALELATCGQGQTVLVRRCEGDGIVSVTLGGGGGSRTYHYAQGKLVGADNAYDCNCNACGGTKWRAGITPICTASPCQACVGGELTATCLE